MKKKLLSILSIFILILGVSGCGNSAPKEVTVTRDQGEVVKLEVGKDIAEGEYTIQSISPNQENEYGIAIQKVGSKDSEIYDVFNSGKFEGSFDCGVDFCLTSTIRTKPVDDISLENGEFLFIGFNPELEESNENYITSVILEKK